MRGLRPKLFPLRPSGPAPSQTHAGLKPPTRSHTRESWISPNIVQLGWTPKRPSLPLRKNEREDKRASEGGVWCFPHICRAKQGPVREGGGSSTGLKHLESRMLIVSCLFKGLFHSDKRFCFLVFPFRIIRVVCFNMAASHSTSTMWRNEEWNGFTCRSDRGAWPWMVCLHNFLHLPLCGTSRARSEKNQADLLMMKTLGQWF